MRSNELHNRTCFRLTFARARRLYTDEHAGRECGIAGTLSTTGLDDDPTCALVFSPPLASAHSARTCLCLRSDHSNADHGGYVLVDDDGRLYVDVVLHNKAPASGSPIDDPLSALERSAAYFV